MNSKRVLNLCLLLSLALGHTAHADLKLGIDFPLVQEANSVSSSVIPMTMGWDFTPVSQIQVTSLGLYDYKVFNGVSPGLATSHEIAIWNANSPGSPLAQLTVPAGETAEFVLDGFRSGWRFTDLNVPITLDAGTKYVVGAFYPNVTSPTDATSDFVAIDSRFVGASELGVGSNLRANFNNGVFSMPSDRGTTLNQYGPNIRFQVVAVPEPSPLILSTVVAIGLIRLRNRKVD